MTTCGHPQCTARGHCNCPAPDGRYAKRRTEPAAQARRRVITTFGAEVIATSDEIEENT